jgi:hypothetical protein
MWTLTQRVLLLAIICASLALIWFSFSYARRSGQFVDAKGVVTSGPGGLVNAKQPFIQIIGPGELQDPIQPYIEISLTRANLKRVLEASEEAEPGNTLDVDLLLITEPTTPYRGKVERVHEQTGLADIRIHPVDGDIPTQFCIDAKFLLRGTAVQARVRLK